LIEDARGDIDYDEEGSGGPDNSFCAGIWGHAVSLARQDYGAEPPIPHRHDEPARLRWHNGMQDRSRFFDRAGGRNYRGSLKAAPLTDR